MLACSIATAANAAIYTREDSIKVVTLLQQGAAQPKDCSLTSYYAKQFLGLPYVAHTLEGHTNEPLVVNLRQLDCTTLVDNCLALALTTQQGSTSFADFCYWLERMRYRDGKRNGYPSRNHYWSQWVRSNTALGLAEEVVSPQTHLQTQKLDLHYMSRHSAAYRMLKDAPQAVKDLIQTYEQELSGQPVAYIPNEMLNKGRDVLTNVRDGDVLALVTSKDGLDVSHLGFAQWGTDGKLHLLNASSIHHKVVLEPMTLYRYMKKHPTNLGIRVFRLKK
ncbi:MAG: DUF1460 domain-containing protein [Bacteroidales bacterium]|nr:DUF1460 domain-containing protein [Candidatus Physcousia equi]